MPAVFQSGGDVVMGSAVAGLFLAMLARHRHLKRGRHRRMVDIQLRLEVALQNTKIAWGGLAPTLPVSVFVGIRGVGRGGALRAIPLVESTKQTEISCDI
jgi:hypothetical protein